MMFPHFGLECFHNSISVPVITMTVTTLNLYAAIELQGFHYFYLIDLDYLDYMGFLYFLSLICILGTMLLIMQSPRHRAQAAFPY